MDVLSFWRPKNFLRLTYLGILVSLFGVTAVWVCILFTFSEMSFIDYQQGEIGNIIFVHVPSAWVSIYLYGVIFITSSSFLVWKHPFFNLLSRSCSIVGSLFTLLTLCTGSLWGYPTWGTFWVWDARLTSVFILFILYICHSYLCAKESSQSDSRAIGSSLLIIIGSINIPIIKYSVDWWNTLHQPASISQSFQSIDYTILFFIMFYMLFFTLLSLLIVLTYLRSYIINYRANSII
uniref:ABC transporter subunit C n=1 Tax=Ophirina amphinema TaxID=2108040 RepID=A0A348AYV2_9EUKA|nr:ABC transporter subunit C [Ophirina amphinema]